MAHLDWNTVAKRARAMSEAALMFAYVDATEASLALRGVPDGNGPTKGEGYYRDEASVYFREIQLRKRGASLREEKGR